MTFTVREIYMGVGKPEWGAPTDSHVFIIKLGEKQETQQNTLFEKKSQI